LKTNADNMVTELQSGSLWVPLFMTCSTASGSSFDNGSLQPWL
jgi:hypothetical protein